MGNSQACARPAPGRRRRAADTAFAWAFVVAAAAACNKVPLESTPGAIDFGAAHWFATEKVAYVFFSLSESPTRLIDPQWRLSWTETSPDGGQVAHPEVALDFTQGVHEHVLVPCGDSRLCGSFSFKSERPLSSAAVRFLYDKNSPLSLSGELAVANHEAGTSQDAYSALGYGVFDKANGRMQVRIHHNFGSPPDEEVAAFGMTRLFRAAGAVLTDADQAAVRDAAAKTGTPLLFPAPFCGAAPAAGDAGAFVFAGAAGWAPGTLDPAVGRAGACFTLDYLDKGGAALLAAPAPAYARRNPELTDGPALTLVTPLAPAVQLPVVIRICPDDPAAPAMVDDRFFTYQEFILGLSGRPVDLCFKIGQEKAFADSLKTLLGRRLADARAHGAGAGDFVFVVLLHERFSPEFTVVQRSVAEALYALASAERLVVSPRLAGAFVYDASVDFRPTAAQAHLVLWCPQNLLATLLSPSAPLADQNCTLTPAAALDLTVINFVAPLGPLPSLAQYSKYVASYGDAGLAKGPTLAFASVPNGVNTLEEAGTQVTYFDNARYAIAAGEAARVCGDRVDAALANFRVRPAAQAANVPGLAAHDINAIWLSGQAAGEYKIGIAWEYPFWGGITYKGALNGKVVSVVPYTKSFDSYKVLGDPKWSAGGFDFGHYVQHCFRYCDNPFFDQAGTYQAAATWRQFPEDSCPAPAYPPAPTGSG